MNDLSQPVQPDDGANPRYKLTLAYDGTNFHGWQKQPGDSPNTPPLRTVGGVVEDSLQHVFRHPIRLVGASRTDAGVHAHGQVAHFNAASRIPLDRLSHAINSRLPDDIAVVDVRPIHPDFDAISDAQRKLYRYRIYNVPLRPLEQRRYVWHCWHALDPDRMRDTGTRIVGTHDFAGFAAAGHGRVTTVRTVLRCDVKLSEPEIHIEVEGTGFLYNMVRIIAGTLIDVGRGRLDPSVVDEIFSKNDRSLAGPTMPASGLCLEWIHYP